VNIRHTHCCHTERSICRCTRGFLHDEKITEPNLVPISFDILLNLSRVLSERERHVRRGLPAASADRRVVGRAEEVGDGVPLRRRVRHHPVLHALVSVVAPCLQIQNTKEDISECRMTKCMHMMVCQIVKKRITHVYGASSSKLSFGLTLKCK
jgi:hypothetical protein